MKNKLAAAALSLFLLAGAAQKAPALEKSTATLDGELRPYGISFGKAGAAPVVSSFKFAVKDMVFHTLAAEDAGRRFELEIIRDISPETAARYIAARYAVIRDLYDPKSIPYGGAVTHDTQCPADMMPEELAAKVLGLPVKIILANASERYTLGVWEKSAVRRKAGFLLLHDAPNRRLFQILVYTDLKDYKGKKIPKLLKGLKRVKPGN